MAYTLPNKDALASFFIKKSSRTRIQLIRYVFVGGLSAVIDTAVFMLCTAAFDLHYLIAQTAGFGAGIATNYLLSILWVFHSSRTRTSEISLFFATGVIGLLLSYVLLYVLIDQLSLTAFDNLIAKLITIAVVFIWNFVSRKAFVFNRNQDTDTPIL